MAENKNEDRAQRAVSFICNSAWSGEVSTARVQGVPLKSYQNEKDPFVHTFDQALGLTVLCDQLLTSQAILGTAQGVIDHLLWTQNENGSWGNTYIRGQGMVGETSAGVVSWVVYALKQYERTLRTVGVQSNKTRPVAAAASRAWKWIKMQQDARLPGAIINIQTDHYPSVTVAITETNIDAWYAAKAMKDDTTADDIFHYLYDTAYVDKQAGRFARGVRPDGQDTALGFDNYSWGARLLHDAGHEDEAYKLVGFALEQFGVFRDGALVGLYSDAKYKKGVDYEATAQLLATYRSLTNAGPSSDSSGLLDGLQRVLEVAQHKDGGVPHNDELGAPDMAYPAINATAWWYWALQHGSPLTISYTAST